MPNARIAINFGMTFYQRDMRNIVRVGHRSTPACHLTFLNLAFYRESLRIQYIQNLLYQNAICLRDITQKNVRQTPYAQRQLAMQSIDLANQALLIIFNSAFYKRGLASGTSHSVRPEQYQDPYLMISC